MNPFPPPDYPLRHAIIDLDGTLVDTLGDFVEVLRLTLGDLGLPAVDRGFVEQTVGKGSEHLLRSTLAHLEASPALYDDCWARYQAHYLRLNGAHADVYPGVLEGLTRLRAAGWRLACLTNKPRNFAVPLLASKGLAGYFDHVFGGDSFARKKPDPLPLLETCKALGSLSAATLMVGDSSNDAAAARAAGCPVILVSYGYNHGQPVSAVDADSVIDRLDELPLGA